MANQYWPDDLFANGATAYGTHPNLYLSIEPWTTNPETTTGQLLRVDQGELFDGHDRAQGSNAELTAFAPHNGSGDYANWCVERTVYGNDFSVALTPDMHVRSGVPGYDTFRQFGVCSHVSGGTLTIPGADTTLEYFTNVKGYFLIETKQAASRHRVLLLEVGLTTPGVITVLGNEEVRVTDPVHAAGNAFEYLPPAKLRLTVDSSGATALIDCYRVAVGGVEKRLFTNQIVRGTALPDGRCGFGMQVIRTSTDPGAAQATGVAKEFVIRNAAQTSRLFVDRFRRVQPQASRQISDGVIAGRSCAQGWFGDGKGRTVTNIESARYLVSGTGASADQIQTGNNISGTIDWPGYFLRQHAPPTREQRYKANMIRLNVDGTTRSEMGLLMRFTCQAFTNFEIDTRGRFSATGLPAGYYKTGYAVYVVHDTAVTPVWQLEIRHHNGSLLNTYAGDVLATADITAAGLTLGTAFELDVEVRNFDGDTFGVGSFVAIVVKINTVTITPVPDPLILGIAENDDFFIDFRSAATTSLGSVGLYFNPDALGTADLAAFLDFSQAALTDAPVIEPDEQASVAVSAETAGASGTLANGVNAQVGEERVTIPVVHRFESGKVQTIRQQAQARRIWSVSEIMENAQWQALLANHEANGNHTPINWTHPYTNEAVVVLFVEDVLSMEELHAEDGRTVYQTSYQLEELFAQSTYNPEL
tara:strand:+ start:42073 stop:44181 length:2109 start_codon:yes stop_codon:yes gene_type:complete